MGHLTHEIIEFILTVMTAAILFLGIDIWVKRKYKS